MPFNGSGVFQRLRNWVADAAAGIKIRADYHDAEDDGFAAGLSNCITKDGQTIVTQNIPWNSKRITGLQDPVNAQDAATKAYADTKLSAAGGKMTGDLEIEKDCPAIILDDTDACGARIRAQHHGVDRWCLELLNSEAETGTGNVGGNFDVLRYDDAGVLLGVPLSISRKDGHVLVSGDLFSARSPTEGVVYLGSDGAHYLYWSGTAYALPSGKLTLGAAGVSGFDAVTMDQLNTKQNALGFTPVQQGGGSNMATNKVYIGWNGAGQLLGQVDASPLGAFAFGSAFINNGRLAFAGDKAVVTSPAGLYEPFGGAVMTGYEWTNVGYPIITYVRFRYMQLFTTSWFTVGYV